MPIINIREQKNLLRAKHKKLRTAYSVELKQKLDNILFEKFTELKEYKECKSLFAFVSMPIEVNTFPILEKALADSKILALPKCRQDEPIMDFYKVNSLDMLKEGKYSIMEPDEEVCEKIAEYTEALCLVPGLSFDLYGYRLGFGKGYYDRFLQNFIGATVGLCYSKCIEQKLPHGIYDKAVDIIITEKFTNDTRNVFEKGMV